MSKTKMSRTKMLVMAEKIAKILIDNNCGLSDGLYDELKELPEETAVDILTRDILRNALSDAEENVSNKE